ncbi:NAD/NADP octopine/nopaline dehydrogenase family protein [Thermoproteota archaeon]
MERIAVLGAGNVGHSVAADLTLKGFKVNLYNRSREVIELIRENGGIELFHGPDMVSEGLAEVDTLTHDINEAVGNVELIIVTTPSFGQQAIAESVAPHLQDGQTIVITPGSAGSLIFYDTIKKYGKEKGLTVAETEVPPFSCRVFAPAKVRYKNRTRNMRLAAFPASRTKQVFNLLKDVFDLKPAKNVLETAVLNVNQIVYTIPVLLNLTYIEQKKGKAFTFPLDGLTPYVSKAMDALDAEKQAICRRLGLEPVPVDDIYKGHGRAIPPYRFGGAKKEYRTEANTMKERFYPPYEDVLNGLVLLSSLGQAYDVPTPIADAVISLSSVIKDMDMRKEGRTLEKLGLAGMTVQELNKYLEEGTRTPH